MVAKYFFATKEGLATLAELRRGVMKFAHMAISCSCDTFIMCTPYAPCMKGNTVF